MATTLPPTTSRSFFDDWKQAYEATPERPIDFVTLSNRPV